VLPIFKAASRLCVLLDDFSYLNATDVGDRMSGWVRFRFRCRCRFRIRFHTRIHGHCL